MKLSSGVLLVCCASLFALTLDDVFKPGVAIPEFGKIAEVDSDVEIPPGTVFKVRFDSGRGAAQGINSTFDSVARFINIKQAAGVPLENVQIAIVVHGSAALDVTKDTFYSAKKKGRNYRRRLTAEGQFGNESCPEATRQTTQDRLGSGEPSCCRRRRGSC